MTHHFITLYFLEKISNKCKWYCLLPESIGRHKRMAAMPVESLSTHSQKKSRRTHSNGLLFNVRSKRNEKNISLIKKQMFQVEIYHRDDIHLTSAYPCIVREVKSNLISSTTRPMPGDVLVRVNEINVSRTQAKAVEKLIKFVIRRIFFSIETNSFCFV